MRFYLKIRNSGFTKKAALKEMRFFKCGYLLACYCFLLFCCLSCKKNDDKKEAFFSANPTKHIINKPAYNKYVLEELDNSAGLSNSSVNCIFQDSQNMLWIGTWDGLNRYDGSNFKTFRPEPGNNNSLSNQVVLKVAEDNKGQIWILTMHGINRYDKASNKFYHYFFSPGSVSPLSESQFSLGLNSNKDVFCSVKGWGIGYFNGKEFRLINIPLLKDKTVKEFQFSGDSHLFVLTEENNLYRFTINREGNKVIASEGIKVSGKIKNFDLLPNNRLLILNTNGEGYTFSQDSTNKQRIGNGFEAVIGHTPQNTILSGKSGYTITNTSGKSIEEPWMPLLSKYKVTSFIRGNDGILWAGTDGDGILKIFPQQQPFKNISKLQMPELDGGIVRCFAKTANSLWVGTKGKGLFHITSGIYPGNAATLQYTNFNEGNSTIDNAVYALCKGNNDLLFIGTDDEGITVLDLNTSKVINWKDIEGSNTCGYFKSVYAIYQDDDKNIWLGTNGYGMIKLKIERNGGSIKIVGYQKFTAISNRTDALNSNIIFSIVPKSKDELWIGTRLGGLSLFNRLTNTFTTYKNNPGNSNSLSNNDILSLAVDSTNKLWIGTSFGLNTLTGYTTHGEAIFKHYTVQNGLPNNTIHGIVPDGKNNIWLSTNFGVAYFNPGNGKFTNYIKSDGLQNNEFADGAFYYDSKSGYIFMGGIKGFNYFEPKTITVSPEIPDLFIDKISGHNQATPYFQGLLVSPKSENAPAITLNHNQNFFDIYLTALTYSNNEKCQYAYELKGFDKNWNNIGNRKIISFTNVPPGNYSLWMKWSNSDGVWTQPVHTADIKVKPVWWQSNAALVVYGSLALCFMFFVRSYNLKRQSLRQNIFFRQREEELHENRLTFFTNIAHEFLTPLTLITGPVQKLFEADNLDDKNRKFVKMIQRNASRLSFLTQQLLEFRKAEQDHLEVKVRHFDLVTILEQIAELFDDWAIDKSIEYALDIPNTLEGWFDKEKVEKILFNLLSNAFKYTPKNGKISLECETDFTNGQKLKIIVVNSGKGIPKEKLDALFDRFFLSDPGQVSDTEMFRTGIGLAYVKRLVTVLRGEILVSSIPDEATTFTIIIPCFKEAFTSTEIDNGNTSALISGHLKDILEETPEKEESLPDKIIAIDKALDKRKKILVVEDEKEIHTYLNSLLGEIYNLTFAFNGAEALRITEKQQPDIIISDVMMPVMDGVELCRIIKTDVHTCHIPFIMLTAKSSVEHRIEGLESGANSYIPKPFYPDHLLVRIQKLLEEKELILQHFAQDTLVDHLPEIPINNDEKAFIKTTIDLIRNNIDNDNLDSAFIEKSIGISNSQLYRKTKEIFNLSPGDLIRTIRLKYAAELLRKNILTVSEVSYKSGFNNRSYFYREFKKMYNTTPKNYQLQFKAKKATF
ncbi:hybrid sensor histidine kinase/response regulator transcription factor [Flavobacterium rhizosphaerae]|uniref:histidine kinase n=1 Tax=Flavobacterium rhizosphaerae TaxID=3163298 RepID=A0ABW8YYB9_9FLAO